MAIAYVSHSPTEALVVALEVGTAYNLQIEQM